MGTLPTHLSGSWTLAVHVHTRLINYVFWCHNHSSTCISAIQNSISSKIALGLMLTLFDRLLIATVGRQMPSSTCFLNFKFRKNVSRFEKRGNFAQNVIFCHFSTCHHSMPPRVLAFQLGLQAGQSFTDPTLEATASLLSWAVSCQSTAQNGNFQTQSTCVLALPIPEVGLARNSLWIQV